MVKNSPAHGQAHLLVEGKQTLYNHSSEPRQLATCLLKHGTRNLISGLSCGLNQGNQCSPVRGWAGIRHQHALLEPLDAPPSGDVCRQACRPGLIVSAEDSGQGGPADPVARPFIGDGETPPPGAGASELGIAPEGNRTRSGNYDHTRTVREGGLPGNDHVRDNFDFAGNNL
jgi:hypothetical protein